MPLFIFMLHLRCGQAQNEICYHSTHVDNWQLSLRVNTLCGAPDSCCKSQWQHFFCHYSRDRDIVNQTWSFGAWLPKIGHLHRSVISQFTGITRPILHQALPAPDKASKLSASALMMRPGATLVTSTNQLWTLVKFQCDAWVTFPKRSLISFLAVVFHFLSDLLKMQIFKLWVASGPTYYLPGPGTATKGSFVGCTCWVYKVNDTRSYFQAEILPPWDVNSTRDAMMLQPNPVQGAERTWLTLHEPLIASG